MPRFTRNTIMLLAMPLIARAAAAQSTTADTGRKSSAVATSLSLAGTFVPVAAGFALWNAEKGQIGMLPEYDGSRYVGSRPQACLPDNINQACTELSRQPASHGREMILIASGLIVGPAIGYVYGGMAGHGIGHAALRTLGITAALAGSFALCGLDCSGGQQERSADLLAAVGALGMVAWSVHDIVSVGHAVTERNRRRSVAVSVQPTIGFTTHAVGARVDLSW